MAMFVSTLVAALMTWLVDGQQTLPPPPRRVPSGPEGLSSFSQVHPFRGFEGVVTYCNLSYPVVYRDPSIISSDQPMMTQTSIDNLLRDAPSARSYRDSLRARNRAQDTTRQQTAIRGSEIPLTFMAPTSKINICNTNQKSVFAVYNGGDKCYTFQEEAINYAECRSKIADVPNAFPDINRWYCVPDSYRDVTFMVICPETAELFRWHTISVPMNCCGRRYVCDFKPYQSLNGPKLF